MDTSKVRHFLAVYIQRCTFIHAFTYMQYRRLATRDKKAQLVEVFGDRKEFLLRILSKMLNKIKSGILIDVNEDGVEFDENPNPPEPKTNAKKKTNWFITEIQTKPTKKDWTREELSYLEEMECEGQV